MDSAICLMLQRISVKYAKIIKWIVICNKKMNVSLMGECGRDQGLLRTIPCATRYTWNTTAKRTVGGGNIKSLRFHGVKIVYIFLVVSIENNTRTRT
jgi:hypothetical protein